MVTRTAVLEYRAKGVRESRGEVISLAEAQATLRRNTAAAAPVMKTHIGDMKVLGSVHQSATAKISSTTNALGPLGAGLGAVSRLAPQAALGVIGFAAANEKAALSSRLLNTAVIGGASAALTASVAFAAYADDIVRAGDTYASLQARINTFTNTAAEAAMVEKELYKTAADARAPVKELTTLWARLSPAVEDYGKSAQDALTLTALTSKALAIQGADIREQAAATIQFSQSIASGVLRGDELRSLLESSPQLLRYVAQNLEINGKVGVAFSSLRKLGEEGALTTERVITALLKAQPQIEADFINAPKTAQQYWQVLQDQIVRGIGQISQATGAQQGVVNWLADLAQKADEFRQKMLSDPRALDPVKESLRFIGDAVGTIGTLGKVAAENFDLIVFAGQAVIALKLGEVFASWFASAATGAKQAIASVQAFRASARFNAGATLDKAAADAAINLRTSALALEAQALEKVARAEILAAEAAAAKTAAYNAQNRVNVLKLTNDERSVVVQQAQAAATAQATLATKLNEQANKAAAGAAAASAAANTRKAASEAAGAAVTARATGAQIAKNAAMAAGLGLYNLLGGAIGIATLALGGLALATWKVEEAFRAKYDAQREVMVISDQLHTITERMTAATWAQIPALQAEAEQLRDNAVAARQAAEEQLRLAEAKRRVIEQSRARVPLGYEDTGGFQLDLAAGRQDRIIGKLQGNLQAARNDEFREEQEAIRQRLVSQRQQASNISKQLLDGKDNGGRSLTQAGRQQLQAQLAALFAEGQRQVDFYSKWQADQQAAISKMADGQGKKNQIASLAVLGDNLQAAADLLQYADSAAGRRATPTAPAATGGRAPAVINADRSAFNALLDEVVRQEYFNKQGGNDFRLDGVKLDVSEKRDAKGKLLSTKRDATGGTVIDTATGQAFVARSADEAAAAQKYTDMVRAITAATDEEIKATGESRDTLKEKASAYLATAIETSKATKAEERWGQIQDEVAGDTKEVIKAEAEINRLRADGAAITDKAAQAYLDFVAAREKGQRMSRAVQFAGGLARDSADTVLAGTVMPTTDRGLIDVEKRTRQIEAARADIILENEARIRVETQREAEAAGLSRAAHEKLLANRIAANALGVEIVLQDELMQLRRDAAQQSAQDYENQIREAVGSIIDLGRDLAHGGGWNAARDFAQGMADALADELVWQPLEQALLELFRKIAKKPGATLAEAVLGAIGEGFGVPGLGNLFGGSTSASAADPLYGLYDTGGWTGAGDPRRAAGVVHEEEFVIKAPYARRHRGMLEAINAGASLGMRGYMAGGYVGGFHPRDWRDPMEPPTAALAELAREVAKAGRGDINVQVHNYAGNDVMTESARGPGGDLRVNIWKLGGKQLMQEGISRGVVAPAGPKKPRTRA